MENLRNGSITSRPCETLLKELRFRLAALCYSVRGNISVEFALVLPFLLLLVLGAYDFGRGFMEKLRLNGAARAGAQYALANYNGTQSTLYPKVQESVWADAEDDTLDVDPNIIYYKCPGADDKFASLPDCGGEVPRRYVKVDVTQTQPFQFLFDYPTTTGSMTLSGHAELRLR